MAKQEQDLIQILKGKLETYLNSFSINRKGDHFSCINPDHADTDPSCSISGKHSKQIFHCFGCGVSGTIFHAAHYLEGLPIHGAEFFTVTLAKLAKRFGLEYEPAQLSDSQKELIQYRNAVSDASQTIVNFALREWDKEPTPHHVAIIKDRGITKETLKDFRIGSIPSIEEYRKVMLDKGWDEEYLIEKKLLHTHETATSIFVPDKIIMTISDHIGRPIAFVARKHKWSETSACSKYVNSSDSSLYAKAGVAFGLDVAKKYIKNKPLCIVEGYIDAITLSQSGYKNVVSLGSASFSEELRNFFIERKSSDSDIKVNDIILCFDGDEAGTICTRNAIDLIAKAQAGFNIYVKQLPFVSGYHDPDEIVRSTGLKGFESIEVLSSFKWDLRYHRERFVEADDIFIKRVTTQIANLDSPIDRRSHARDLHEVLAVKGTMFTIDDIIKEVDHCRGEKASKLQTELEGIFDAMMQKRKTAKSTDLVELLSTSFAQIKQKQREHSQKLGNLDEIFLKQANDVRQLFRKVKQINGFKMTRFRKLQELFDGFPDKECLFAVAGDSNIGKSTWIREVSWDLAQSNPDAIVLYMSIDDSIKDVMMALVAREAEYERSTVYKYGKLASEPGQSDVVEKIDAAWESVLKQKNYIVADASQGSSIMHLEDHLAYIRKTFPDKRPIVFLDNFHKLRYSEEGSIREKFIDMVQRLKEITQIEDVPIVMTVELRKTEHGKRPNLGDIAETKQIEYDAKVVMMAHQEMHNNPETLIRWHRDDYNAARNLPYLELQIAKNKHTDKKCMIGYRFEPDRSILTEVEYETEIQPKRFPARNLNN